MEALLALSELPYEEFRLGSYRTRDAISNFRFRVRIRKVVPSVSVPQKSGNRRSSSSGGGTGSRESVRSSSLASNDFYGTEDANFLDDQVIGWQQKVFNEVSKNMLKLKFNNNFKI